jgi:23S rRNA (uracil1939-C5)-methyltransferase
MMTVAAGRVIELIIEKPAAGGRMIARHDGQVVLVAGAIPGERVVARVERVDRRVAFATVVDVVQPSSDRREGLADPLCGGCVYSHIAYQRQLDLKAEIVRDAFVRIGRIPVEAPIDVAPSGERGYRMRARLHVSRGTAGFYREGTHTLCDAAPSGQLTDAALETIASTVSALERGGAHPTSVEITENIPGDQRALAVELGGGSSVTREALENVSAASGLRGCVARDEQGRRVSVGDPFVADSFSVLTNGRVTQGDLRRHPDSFFQANRFVIPALVNAVLDAIPAERDVLDLYAGVGLFAIGMAASGAGHVTAVEGDRSSGSDLRANARAFEASLTVAVGSVEDHLAGSPARPSTVILDPPRTGLSPEAIAGLLPLRAGRIAYVSCDPATMARDARKLLDGGYRLESLRAFDLFPSTPHVEALGVFVR